MIDAALNTLATALDRHLRASFELAESVVITANMSDLGEAESEHTDRQVGGKIVFCLANVGGDAALGSMLASSRGSAGLAAPKVPPPNLNIQLVVASDFSAGQYAEALKFLSASMAFFQNSPVFDHTNTPDLDQRITRLSLELENLGFNELANLWVMLGSDYRPSAVYKLRLIASIDDEATAPVTSGPGPSQIPGFINKKVS